MSPTVALLRALSLLALASPMFIGKRRPAPEDRLRPDQTVRARLAVFTNFGAVGLFFPALVIFAGSTHAPWALALGVVGCAIAVTGSVIVWKSRLELGAAWSLLPKAGDQTGWSRVVPIASFVTRFIWACQLWRLAKPSHLAAGLPS